MQLQKFKTYIITHKVRPYVALKCENGECHGKITVAVDY